LNRRQQRKQTVSIIIPTLNEAGQLARTIQSLRQQRPHEIIVVDGGSTDRTAEEADGADRFITAPRGRAHQMNAGALAASGQIFLFIHADCRLEEDALAEVACCLQRRDVAAGCFRMTVDAPDLVYRCIDFAATARVRLTGLAYGDQGLFVRRQVFEQLGGFPPIRLMEDVRFSHRLRSRGRVVVASHRILVSPRRWQKAGVIRQTLRNWSLLSLAACGVPPDGLARWYPEVR
jgi:rSAM/selenodomain-associated transferase 2